MQKESITLAGEALGLRSWKSRQTWTTGVFGPFSPFSMAISIEPKLARPPQLPKKASQGKQGRPWALRRFIHVEKIGLEPKKRLKEIEHIVVMAFQNF